MTRRERVRRMVLFLPVLVGIEVIFGWLWGWRAMVSSVALLVVWDVVGRFARAVGQRGFPK